MSERKGIADELHKPARKRFPTRNFELKGINDLYEADLVEMIPYSEENGDFKYIMTVINCFSKFAFAVPLKSKGAVEVAKAIEPILQRNKMKNLHTDEGKEWFNRTFSTLMKRYGINHYLTYSGKKAVFVERFNRSLKGMMWRKFTEVGSYRWIDILQELVDKYNDTVHNTIKMKPKDVSKKNEGEVMYNITKFRKNSSAASKPEFKEGDRVIISKHKILFDKEHIPQWVNEIFTIDKIVSVSPTTYKITSLRKNNDYIFKRGDKVRISKYRKILDKGYLPSWTNEVFAIDKVMHKSTTSFNITSLRKKRSTVTKQTFKKGDKVRISKYKKIFDKGYLPNWSNEIFTISKVVHTSPITYKLVDERGEEIKGGFYTEELQKTKYGDVFLIEKIIRRRGKRLLIRWKGHSPSADSWIDEKDLI